MAARSLTTFKDCIDQMHDFLGANPEQKALRDAKRAVLEAYREFAAAHRWLYYYSQNRIVTSAAYETGTVAFDFTGGTYERQLTLSGGTWPTWALYGVVRINNIDYDVADRKSGTVLTLETNSNPGEDVAAGTTYTIYRDSYTLPSDFLAMDRLKSELGRLTLKYVHPREWLAAKRYYGTGGYPCIYTIIGDPNLYGKLSLAIWPYPTDVQTLDYIYQRRGRNLAIAEYKTGTASVSAASTTITGIGTTFTADMVGSVIRVSSSASVAPGPVWGNDPFAEERIVFGYTNATTLVADVAFNTTLSGVKYNISDPIDIEEGAMLNGFLRCCERRLATNRGMKTLPLVEATYQMALQEAKAADSRSFAIRVAGGVRHGLVTYPIAVTDG